MYVVQARILSKLDHPYVIKHYLSFIEDNTLNIIMELARSGTLYHLRNGPRLDEDRVWKYCIQMLLAMEYIHSKKIIHRDIKTLNLMLDAHDDVKLGRPLWVVESLLIISALPVSAAAGQYVCRGLWHCEVTEYRN